MQSFLSAPESKTCAPILNTVVIKLGSYSFLVAKGFGPNSSLSSPSLLAAYAQPPSAVLPFELRPLLSSLPRTILQIFSKDQFQETEIMDREDKWEGET